MKAFYQQDSRGNSIWIWMIGSETKAEFKSGLSEILKFGKVKWVEKKGCWKIVNTLTNRKRLNRLGFVEVTLDELKI